MDKLKIASIKGAIKRSPKSLAKWFSPDSFAHYDNLINPALQEVDVFIQTNLIKWKFYIRGRNEQYEYILNSKKPKLVSESPVFRSVTLKDPKMQLQRLGWNSYQHGDCDYNNKNSLPDRWNWMQKEYSIARKDWKKNGDYILLLLQKPGDSSLNKLYIENGYNIFRYGDWVKDTVKNIRKHTDRKIIIRPHINQQTNGYKNAERVALEFDNVEVSSNYEWLPEFGASGGTGLQQDLSNAWCAVTYNSLSSIESVLSGTPVVALDKGCMAWPVAEHSLANIENLSRNHDISQWLYDLSYSCWTAEELTSGKTWEHLKPKYEYWKAKTLQNNTKEIQLWKEYLNK